MWLKKVTKGNQWKKDVCTVKIYLTTARNSTNSLSHEKNKVWKLSSSKTKL